MKDPIQTPKQFEREMEAKHKEREREAQKIAFADAKPIKIVAIDLPFWKIVTLMVKWVIASIPAGIILFLIGAMLWGVLLGLVGGLHR